MRRLEDYLALDRKRRKRYEGLGAALLTDYRILDASLTETAFRGIERSCFHYGTKGVQNG